MSGALSYALCNQTVTVYNAYGPAAAKQYKRTVIEHGAFLDWNRQWKETKLGSAGNSSFLLVLPVNAGGLCFVPGGEFAGEENTFTLQNGDKVFAGVGPEVASAADWAALVPATVTGLVVVKSVDVKTGLDGRATHIEAG